MCVYVRVLDYKALAKSIYVCVCSLSATASPARARGGQTKRLKIVQPLAQSEVVIGLWLKSARA